MDKKKELDFNLDLDLNDKLEKNMVAAWEASRETRESEGAEWADEASDDAPDNK